MTITYLHNSGFAVDLGGLLLIFDYWKDSGPRGLKHGTVDANELERYHRVIAFASHAHPDHFNPVIATWPAELVLSYDIPDRYPATYMKPGDIADLDGVRIEAFDSTDEGVSFLVTAQGVALFHAGDLNCWHWQDESTPEEAAEMRARFVKAIAPLRGRHADVAFLPVDSRLKTDYDEGALAMAALLTPGVIVPMHAHGDRAAVEGYAKQQGGDVRILLDRGATTEVLT